MTSAWNGLIGPWLAASSHTAGSHIDAYDVASPLTGAGLERNGWWISTCRQRFSWPSRRLAGAITTLWFVAAVPGLAVLMRRNPRLGPLGEALSYLVLALALASVTALRAAFAQLSRSLGALLVVAAVLMLFGQLGGGGRQFFPLVRFNVYTDSPDSVVHQLEGLTKTGNRCCIRRRRLHLWAGPLQLYTSLLRATGLSSGTATDGRHDSAVDDYRRFLLAIIRQYNDEHQARPLVACTNPNATAPD